MIRRFTATAPDGTVYEGTQFSIGVSVLCNPDYGLHWAYASTEALTDAVNVTWIDQPEEST